MANWFLSFAGVFTPIGVVILVFTAEKAANGWMFYAGIALGFAFIALGVWVLFHALRILQLEKKRDNEHDEYRFQELMKELRGMRSDLTRNKKQQKDRVKI